MHTRPWERAKFGVWIALGATTTVAGACKKEDHHGPSSGAGGTTSIAPTTETTAAPTAETPTAAPSNAFGPPGPDAAAVGTTTAATKPWWGRALPPEPPCGMCRIECVAPSSTPLARSLPAPFERCATTIKGGSGQFSVRLTKSNRASGKNECCYMFPDDHPPLGRPLIVDGDLRLAPSCAGRDWIDERMADAARTGGPFGTGRLTDVEWLSRAGATEHASIAAFSKLSLDLLALGAPPHLVSAAHGAALEELEHARLFYALASARGEADVGPGPLDTRGALDREATFTELALGCLREGCIGETEGARDVYALAEEADSDALRTALERVALEETQHAALSFEIVAWAMAAGGERVEREVARLLGELGARDPAMHAHVSYGLELASRGQCSQMNGRATSEPSARASCTS